MKKLVSAVLAFVMLTSMFTTASAATMGDMLDRYSIANPFDIGTLAVKVSARKTGDQAYSADGLKLLTAKETGEASGVDYLAELDMQITLSISLHAPDDETRNEIMPVNKKWGVAELLRACRDYYKATGRRISFEYTLISGKNDSCENAKKLADVLNGALRSRDEGMPIHVNLIPVNEVDETGFKSSDRAQVKQFAATLEKRGIRATIRRTLGSDINASCGQLRREDSAEN